MDQQARKATRRFVRGLDIIVFRSIGQHSAQTAIPGLETLKKEIESREADFPEGPCPAEQAREFKVHEEFAETGQPDIIPVLDFKTPNPKRQEIRIYLGFPDDGFTAQVVTSRIDDAPFDQNWRQVKTGQTVSQECNDGPKPLAPGV